jgi:hypothetical protein
MFKITPIATGVETIQYIGGHPVIGDKTGSGTVFVQITSEVINTDQYLFLRILIMNDADHVLNVGFQDVTAKTDKGALPILAVADLEVMAQKDVARRVSAARWQAFAAALGGVGAAMQSNSGSYNSTATTFGNTTTVNGTYTAPVDNSYATAAAAQHMAQAQANAAAARDSMDPEMAIARAKGFRPVSIAVKGHEELPAPLDHFPRDAKHFTITVTLDGVPSTFEYDLAKVK